MFADPNDYGDINDGMAEREAESFEADYAAAQTAIHHAWVTVTNNGANPGMFGPCDCNRCKSGGTPPDDVRDMDRVLAASLDRWLTTPPEERYSHCECEGNYCSCVEANVDDSEEAYDNYAEGTEY